MSVTSETRRRLVIVTDTERYSARTTRLQHEAQAVFREALDAAAAEAGLDRAGWDCQPSGDGELAVLPQDTDEPVLLAGYLAALDAYLRSYNADRAKAARIRIRLAVNQGLFFTRSRNGFAGDAVNVTARLADAPALKAAFQHFPAAAVACIVSDGIYRDVVAGGYDGVRPEAYRRVRAEIADKGFAEPAWIRIVGEDVNDVETPLPGDEPAAEPPPTGRPAQPDAGYSGIRVGDVESRGQLAIGNNATLNAYRSGKRTR
ncbi:hypothetical protein AB0F81_32320 [Actinoplanes sp. NPDC024001]|uniref:hypothetical protein n=1 Tax=Actinoplanes sp. NPDC024001 TaxID=3154598 RepID=UPI0033DCC796